ncbi:MAG: RDD family protein [Pseudomonadota bacterium]
MTQYSSHSAENKETTSISTQPYQLATLGQRLLASLIDGFIASIPSLFVMGYVGDLQSLQQGSLNPSLPKIMLYIVSGIFFFILIQGKSLDATGQTIGKKILNIKTVSLNLKKPSLFTLLYKRYLPIYLLTGIPVVGAFIAIFDVCSIFRKDRRCLHDLIANTLVVKMKS